MSFTQSPTATLAPPLQLDIRSLSFERWKELTNAGLLHARGTNLQRLDAALQAYLANRQSVDSLNDLRLAFRAWAAHKYQQKGKFLNFPDDFARPIDQQIWAQEPRNARGAITALFRLLYSPELLALEAGRVRQMRAEELEAIGWWKAEIDARAYTIFKDQRLQFRLLTAGAPPVRISQAGDYPAQGLADALAALPAGGATAPGAPAPAAGRLAAFGAGVSGLASQAGAAAQRAGAAASNYGSVAGIEAASTAYTVYAYGAAAAKLGATIEQAIGTMARTSDPAVPALILKAMGLPAAGEIAARMAPLLGPAVTALMGGVDIGRAVMAKRASTRIDARQELFRAGSAREAVQGVARLLEKEAKARAKSGARQLLTGGAGIALFFTDAGAVSGPAVAAAETLAGILVLAAEYIDDYFHMQQMNSYLGGLVTSQTMDVGVDLFQRSPLLGAYYLLIAETSTITAVCLENLGQPGVMQQIETIVREDLPEVLEKAADLIEASHLVVPGLLSHRLRAERTAASRAGAAMKGFAGRLASVACYVKNLGTPPPRDPRYVGISWEDTQAGPLLVVPTLD